MYRCKVSAEAVAKRDELVFQAAKDAGKSHNSAESITMVAHLDKELWCGVKLQTVTLSHSMVRFSSTIYIPGMYMWQEAARILLCIFCAYHLAARKI